MRRSPFRRRAFFRCAALLLAASCAATSVQAQEGLTQQFEAMKQRIVELEARQAQEAQASAQRIDLLEQRLAEAQSRLGRLKIVHQTGWLHGARNAGAIHSLRQPVDSTFCYLTGVQGQFEGFGEAGEIFASSNVWHLRVADHKKDVKFRVSCVGLPGQES